MKNSVSCIKLLVSGFLFKRIFKKKIRFQIKKGKMENYFKLFSDTSLRKKFLSPQLKAGIGKENNSMTYKFLYFKN